MIEAFEAKIREEINKGYVIDDILSSVVTEQGEILLNNYGFKLIKDYTKTAQYKLYKKDGKDIC